MVSKVKTMKSRLYPDLKSASATAWVRTEDGGLKGMFIYGHLFPADGSASVEMRINTKRETLSVQNRGINSASAQFDTPYGVVKARVVNRRLFVTAPNGVELE